ncbi:MAG: fibronectin type III domain-containing protein, partial [Clostridiales Family XIII bacterium]|nr:fibronectin type III domain-containing protein [Clostridiales Family XIII bacterium]
DDVKGLEDTPQLTVSLGSDGMPVLSATPTASSPLDLAVLPDYAVKVKDKVWTGKKLSKGLSVSIVYRLDGKLVTIPLKEGVDYTLSGAGANKNIGKGTVTLIGKAGSLYKGIKPTTFKIVPKKPTKLVVEPRKNALRVTFKKLSATQKVTTYRVQYRVKGTAKWKSRTVTVKLTGAAAQKTTAGLTLKPLPGKKVWEVRVYAYKGAYKGAATAIVSRKAS